MLGKARQHLRGARLGIELVAQLQGLPTADCGLVQPLGAGGSFEPGGIHLGMNGYGSD